MTQTQTHYVVQTAAGYAAILQAAMDRALPLSFKADLTRHDRRAIERRPDAQFAWILRDGGTHLVWADVDANYGTFGRDAVAGVRCIADTYRGPVDQIRGYYFWDGEQLLGSERRTLEELCWLIAHSRDYGNTHEDWCPCCSESRAVSRV